MSTNTSVMRMTAEDQEAARDAAKVLRAEMACGMIDPARANLEEVAVFLEELGDRDLVQVQLEERHGIRTISGAAYLNSPEWEKLQEDVDRALGRST